jgi:serine/threonine-protein kinase
MVYVPGGEFRMGNDDGDDYEKPAHTVSVNPFFIDVTEVTCGDYEQVFNEEELTVRRGRRAGLCPQGAGFRPVTGVEWGDADAFCRGRGKRLPTEAEWEFAARGTDGRLYPWGNEWRAQAANADGAFDHVLDVGTEAGRSPFGAFDMVGNVWEWTASELTAYTGGRVPPPPFPADWRVIRGGSFDTKRNQATTTYRRGYPARGARDYSKIGFRCVSASQNSPTSP